MNLQRNKKKNICIVINVDNVVDIITNSSSELFVLEGETKEIVEEMIKDIYPDYKNEYKEVVCLRDASDDDIITYFDYVINSCYNFYDQTRGMNEEGKRKFEIKKAIETAAKYGMQPEDFYQNWKETCERKWFHTDISSEGLKTIANKLDPHGKIFLLYSIDDNPNWEMQENLISIGRRYHLG